jgi:hypothetical protein
MSLSYFFRRTFAAFKAIVFRRVVATSSVLCVAKSSKLLYPNRPLANLNMQEAYGHDVANKIHAREDAG